MLFMFICSAYTSLSIGEAVSFEVHKSFASCVSTELYGGWSNLVPSPLPLMYHNTVEPLTASGAVHPPAVQYVCRNKDLGRPADEVNTTQESLYGSNSWTEQQNSWVKSLSHSRSCKTNYIGGGSRGQGGPQMVPQIYEFVWHLLPNSCAFDSG